MLTIKSVASNVQSVISRMTSQVLKFVDSSKAQKFKYLGKEMLFFFSQSDSLIIHYGL